MMRARDFDRETFLSETWPAALESGEFKQGQGQLVMVVDYSKQLYCCLGVACELLSRLKLLPRKVWEDEAELPDKAQKLLGIDASGSYDDHSDNLIKANDVRKRNFKQIARTIRSAAKHKRFVTTATD